MRRIAGAFLALGLLAAAPPAAAAPFDPDPWLADLDQLRDAMSARYPNLEWQTERGLDLPATYALARQRINDAHDEAEARRAFERFLRRFADGHMALKWPASPLAASSPPAAPAPLCSRLGFFDIGNNGAVATRLAGFRMVGDPTGPLPAGVLEVDGRRIGVLRVSMFDPHGFPRLCEQVLASLKLSTDSPCDKACEDTVSRRVDAIFVNAMSGQLRAIAAEKPHAMLIDIAQNGGGNDSAIVLARMLTAKQIPSPRIGIVRMTEWDADFAARQKTLDVALKTASGADKALLAELTARITHARREIARTCDRAPLWRGEPITCSQVVTDTLFAVGMLKDDPEWIRGKPWTESVSNTSRFPAPETLWTGPLMVLVDGDAASASELFAAMLQDSGAALILGAPTFGAGCGHFLEVEPVSLANSGGTVAMPDCLRLRANGDNEMGGIEPDIFLGLRPLDTPKERAERLTRALPTALRALGL